MLMRSLFETQSDFTDALRNPDHPVPSMLATCKDEKPKKRFDIYRNNVVVGMIEGLRSTFPAIERLVGEEFFKATAKAYLEHEPPTSPLLFRYGKTFGAFLDRFPPAETVPYLGDVARLEWARLEAYHAPDRDSISIERLGEIPPEEAGQVSFTLHPSLTLIRSTWPVVSLWAASTDRGSSDDVNMNSHEDAAIIRPEMEVDTRLLPAGGFPFMILLKEGAGLERAALGATEAVGDFDLATHLQGLFEIGAVTAITRDHREFGE